MSTGTSTPTNAYAASSTFNQASSSLYLGVTRSRTLLFQSFRDSVPRDRKSKHAFGYDEGFSSSTSTPGKGKRRAGAYFDASGELQEESEGLLGVEGQAQYPPSQDTHRIDMTGLPPRWIDVSDEVESILTALRPKILHLEKLHAKHVLPGFVDRSGEEREIEKETTEVTREFRRCSKLIASLTQHTQSLMRSGKASKREYAMAQNVQTALATRVQDVSGTFRRKQSNYMQRLRGHEIRHQDLQSSSSMSRSGTTVTRDSEWAVQEDMELSRQQLASSRSNQSQSQAQLLLDEEETAAPVQADANIAQRDREIDQIAKSIADLAELFQDLSALVIDQGTMLDRIDFNIEHMGQDMNAAVEELNTATKYQKRTSRGQCILLLVLLIFLCITVIVVKPFWRTFSP
ncbi:hypothetical protein CBS101457_003365 [Exobasidium rhododendri]|nr:hypothetical protein CBS101457_003365 [Exobasidium rhododendri]